MGTGAGMVETGKIPSDAGRVPLANGDAAALTAASTWDTEANIFVRLLRAAAEIPQLTKDGEIKSGSGSNEKILYSYISHDNVSMHAKKALLKHGVYFMPEITDIRQEGNRTEIRIHGHFINVDDESDRVTYPGIGYGIDSSDKGPGKAWSYACKYVLAKALMMNTAEDIEACDPKFEPDAARTIKQEASEDKKATLKATLNNLKKAIEKATSVEEINQLQRENRQVLMSDEVPDFTREYFVELVESCKKLLGGDNAGQ